MNENPEGTPNPLNPMMENKNEDMTTGTGVPENPEPAVESDSAEAPEPAIEPDSVESETEPKPIETPEPIEAPKPATAPASFAQVNKTPRINHSVVDPMMRPVSRPNAPEVVQEQTTRNENFDTLGIDDATINELKPTPATPITPADTPELVAKDSVVEPVGGKGGKKKALIICGIILLISAIICGAAAIAIVMTNNSGDKVAKAIEKMLDGGMPTIIAAQGTITTSSDTDTDYVTTDASTSIITKSTAIDFSGTFDTTSPMNKIKANVDAEFTSGGEMSLELEEMRNKDGDTFFKVSGIDSILNLMSPAATVTENAETVTDCINSQDTNCTTVTTSDLTTTAGTISVYQGVLDTVDDQWILVSDDFVDSMDDLEIFDNSSVCLINAFGTLPKYAKDIASKYRSNQFITYSTDKLEISKKKNDLYRLGFDNNKLTAFINSLSNNGFVNELSACIDGKATNSDVAVDMIENIFKTFPTIYAEVDNNNNFTRFYLKANTTMGNITTATTADISLTYPSELKISDPEDYINMSTLLNGVMTGVFSGNTATTNTANQ